jgi:UDP-N-acetyl-D-glucosamine dehydrogenase
VNSDIKDMLSFGREGTGVMSYKVELLNKIENKELRIGIVGLGYVGLPLAVEFARHEYKTTGFEVSTEKTQLINSGTNYISDIDNNTFSTVTSSGLLKATTDFSQISDMDFIAICVPSPLDKYGQPNMSYITSSTESIGKHLKKSTIIVLESTTYPGTTEELVMPLLEGLSELKCGVDFYLGFSPERIDPGNLQYKTGNTPKVIGGVGEEATELIGAVYQSVLSSKVHPVSSPAVAEMEKILENTYRNVNIALINEMTMLCEKMNLNIWEVIEAASTKPYGFQPFYPGAGPGGHCIPLDPSYLSWKASEYKFHTSIIEAAGAINDRMPEYCVNRVVFLLNTIKKPVNGSSILVLGVAYKPNIDDYRESAALKVIDLLEAKGASINFYDPFISKYVYEGRTYCGLATIDECQISTYDIVIVATAHSDIDYDAVCAEAQMIFDISNATRNTKNNKVFLL